MKKVSTVAMMQSRNFSTQEKLTIGLDLGDRHSWYCVVDGAGQIQLEQRVRLGKACTKCSAERRAVGPRWRPGHILPGSVACSASWGTK